MSTVHEHNLIVPAEAIDENGHVNHVEYVRWLSEAARSHAMACGGAEWAERLGVAWFVRRHSIEYLRQLRRDEPVVVKTWVENFQRASSLRRYEVIGQSHLAARAETEWILVDRKSGRPCRIPPELSACFGTHTADAATA